MLTNRFLTLPCLAFTGLLLGSCSGGDAPAPQETAQVAPSAETAATTPQAETQKSPADIAQGFFDTLMANGEADVDAFLTQQSLAAMEDGESSFHGDRIDSFTVGETTIDAETARQDVTLTQDGSDNELSLLLRLQDDTWRIHGFAMPFPGGEEWVIDFEAENGVLEELADTMATELAAGFEEAFQGIADEMAAGMGDWEANWSAEQALEQTQLFESLAIGNLDQLQPNWSGSLHGEARPASAVLNEILEGTGLNFDHGEFASRLEKPSQLRLEGFSRIAALEALSAEIGLTPVYEQSFGSSKESESTLTWNDGVRTPAMSFAGPFGIYIRELTEQAPNPTGEIEVCARAIGIGPEIMSSNARMFEVITVSSARGTNGKELLIDQEQHWQTEPRRVASHLSVRQDYDLGGLLRGVEAIESTEGSVQIGAATQLQRFEINEGQETLEINGETASIKWTETGFSANFASFPLEGFDSDRFKTHLAAWNAAGEPVQLTSSGGVGWNGKLKIQAEYEEKPARFGLAFYTIEERSLPFQLSPYPLTQFEQQPGSIASLQFDGSVPVSVEFRSFAADTNPDFPEADFELRNHSNKAVREMSTQFVYRDASGKELKDFPHTLQGDFDFDGHKPLTKPGETREHRTVAFFRPEDTSSISVQIKSIEFTDGTNWKADE